MHIWRRVRAVECASLLKRYGPSKGHRGFESLRLRINFKGPKAEAAGALKLTANRL
jgi:hypothetical protein